MAGRKTAQVLVDKAPYSIDKPFDYLIPPEMEETLCRGCRVMVPFGGGNKRVQGLVIDRAESIGFEGRLKPVIAQLDQSPYVSQEQFALIEYLREYTFCTGYEAVRAVLPTGANVEPVVGYRLTERIDTVELSDFPESRRRLIEFLRTAKTEKELAAFLDCAKSPAKTAAVKELLEAGLLERTEKYCPRVAKKKTRMVRLNPDFSVETEKLSRKQADIIGVLRQIGCAQSKELCYHCGVTDAVVRTLIKKNILLPFEEEVAPAPAKPVPPSENTMDIRLSAKQQAAFTGLAELMAKDQPAAALLYGVTGSGKTQIYIKLIEKALNIGKTALLLVPEISLTPQLVGRFRALFGGVIAVIHSGLSMAERLAEDGRIRAGTAKIVIGTRSAVFAPLQNIGVMILDEEGESSYKSDSDPRYHAREVAKFRCKWHNALLLLGSATPSIDSYFRVEQGKYHLFSLEERFADAQLPQVYLVDMRVEERQFPPNPLSGILLEQLALNLQAQEQSILLINRRGYQTVATCLQCGSVLKCPDCSVAMTYHKVNGRLMCHYCGHTEPFSAKCPDCGGEYLKLSGVGTQKLEDELKLRLPAARLLRMDADTTFSRDAYEKKFSAFQRGEYDILVGTQMVAKGLDFPNVTLVGVLNADSGLYSADFRSGERVFSLITQVVGRSGRSEKSGRAYIQTYDPDNPVIAFAANQDFPGFYADEISVRRALTYPPFCDITLLGFAGADERQTEQCARLALEFLREEAKTVPGVALKALGAVPATISRIAGKYRWRILLKCRMNAPMRALLSRLLRRCGNDRRFAGISIWADVNGDIG